MRRRRILAGFRSWVETGALLGEVRGTMGQTAQGLILGSRGSDLALKQTRMVVEGLRAAGWQNSLETKVIQTTGDRRQDLRLAAHDLDKAVFTRELEEALSAGTIDAAVHSLKDVPTLLDPAYQLVAVLPRAPVEDVLVTKIPRHAQSGLASLPPGAVVATSSLRRAFQLRHLRPDLRVVDIRGNVPTRLRKVAAQPEIDATILACAGLQRLGLVPEGLLLRLEEGAEVGFSILPPDVLLPAAGQGAIAVEIRAGDERAGATLGLVNDPPTWRRIRMERAFLAALGAGCQTPVGIFTRLEEGGTVLAADAVVFEASGGKPRRGAVRGAADAAEELASALCRVLA